MKKVGRTKEMTKIRIVNLRETSSKRRAASDGTRQAARFKRRMGKTLESRKRRK